MKFKYLFCFLSFVIIISLFISSTCAANLDCNSIVSSVEYGKGKLISWGAEGFLVYGTNVMEDNA